MARINLLPWREEARRERQRQFLYSLMATLVLGAVLVLIVGVFFDEVADGLAPIYAKPVWFLLRPAVRSLVLSLAAGAIESILPLVRGTE